MIKKIEGELVNLELVKEKNAEFILELRNDVGLNKYISATSINLTDQKKWIINYFEREKNGKEYYFIIKNRNNNISCGTVRIYNIKNKTATWGSFILNKNRPNGSAYEVIRLSLEYAFNELNIETIFLDVKKANKKAIYIYIKSGFKYISKDENNEYYQLVKKDYLLKLRGKIVR